METSATEEREDSPFHGNRRAHQITAQALTTLPVAAQALIGTPVHQYSRFRSDWVQLTGVPVAGCKPLSRKGYICLDSLDTRNLIGEKRTCVTIGLYRTDPADLCGATMRSKYQVRVEAFNDSKPQDAHRIDTGKRSVAAVTVIERHDAEPAVDGRCSDAYVVRDSSLTGNGG